MNMSERENGYSALTTRTVRNRISAAVWEQIKTGYAAGIGLREIARKMNIPEGTVLAHAQRYGWTQQIQAATGPLTVVQSDAITPVQSVPQSIASILNERKERSKLSLAKYTAEAAEEAAEHQDKLGIARNVRDVAAVRSTLWPEDHNERGILNIAFLTGEIPLRAIPPGEEGHVPEVWAGDQEEEKSKELPSPVFAQSAEVVQPALGCSGTDVIAETTPVPVKSASVDAQPAEVVNSLWEEPRESAVIFKRRRSRWG